MKKKLKDLNKWKDVPFLWTRSLDIVMNSVLLNLIYRFIIILSKKQNYAEPVNKLVIKVI